MNMQTRLKKIFCLRYPMSHNHLCCPTDRQAVEGVMPDLDGKTVSISFENAEPINCYVTGSSRNWLVIIYDIFGMHPNKYEMADWLAKHKGLSVAIPDIRRGKNWPKNMYPPPTPESKEAFYKYLEGDANLKLRALDTIHCISYLRKTFDVGSISILGLCWGAKVAALIDSNGGSVSCIIGAHPSFLKSEDGENATVPILMLPCAEDNLTVYCAGILRNKNSSLFSISENYFGTFHGFLGARGQWTLPNEKLFVDKAKEEISNFIFKHVSGAKQASCCGKSTRCAGLPPIPKEQECPN